jgi:FkbH-like protein
MGCLNGGLVEMSLLHRKLSWRSVQRARTANVQLLRTTVLATFTVNGFEPFLGVAAHEGSVDLGIDIGPYDQILASCLNPQSEVAASRPDVLVVWPQFEDLWRALPAPLSDELDAYTAAIEEVADAVVGAAAEWGSRLVFVLPHIPVVRPLGVGDFGNPRGVVAAAETARLVLRERLCAAGALIADADAAVRLVGESNAFDQRTWTSARVPFTDALFNEVGQQVGRLLRLSIRGAAKVAVVDADNTLWGGVVGEDGADGIDLLDNGPGEAFRAFQRWLLELRRAGAIVALASKNNESDLWPAFDRREMVLQREHLAAWRVNWQPKPVNLSEIADELNLGTASMVFIDDNPVEISAMSELLPEITSLMMPADPSQWVRTVAASGALDRLPPTSDDLKRAEGYQVETQRRELKASLGSNSYRASLGLSVSLLTPREADVARLGQLIAKTNQFTLGGTRHSEPQLRAMLQSERCVVRLCSARDRFGDYGVVGAYIVQREDGGCGVLDTFVLSCRAMGRGVEEAMLASAVEAAGGSLAITVVETPKNTPGRSFFATVGALPDAVAVIDTAQWPAAVEVVQDKVVETDASKTVAPAAE